jgi:hypothetical protein
VSSMDFQKLNVAILTADIAQAKSLSDNLREFGIFAHYHQELDEFWVAINSQKPDLCIVDVAKMSQGGLVFKNHPRVLKDDLNYAFFYSEESKFLLNSTYHLPHIGYIRSEVNLKGQLESLLSRVLRDKDGVRREKFLQARIQRLQKRSSRLVSDINESVKFHERLNTVNSLIEYVENNVDKFDFNSVICQMFCDWEGVKSFGMYELNKSGQKLVSHAFSRKKYHALPQLWLGKTCEDGIESFAQDMALQVAIDVVGSNLRTVEIHGQYDNPDILLLVETNEELTENFNWKLFQDLISGLYRKDLLRVSSRVTNSRFLSPWEALSLQDDIYYHQKTNEVKLINIEFSKLIGQVKSHYNNRFYWKAFYQDFIHHLDAQLGQGAYFTEYGVHELLIFCERENFDKDLLAIKSFVKTFAYWRYFEDSSLVMAKDAQPSVKVINPSSINYLRMVDQHFDDLEGAISLATKRASEILAPTDM